MYFFFILKAWALVLKHMLKLNFPAQSIEREGSCFITWFPGYNTD